MLWERQLFDGGKGYDTTELVSLDNRSLKDEENTQAGTSKHGAALYR